MKKRIIAFMLLAALLLQVPMAVQAADTVFMVPEISVDWEPPGTLYKSPNLDTLAYKSPPGLVADIINNRGLVAALTDLNANVSPSDYGASVLGIYPEGEIITDEVMQMIANGGWARTEIYYPTFLLSDAPNCGGMTPVIEKTENPDLTRVLSTAGYTEQVAVFKIEGVAFINPRITFYEPEFSFLRGGSCTMYKYIPDIEKFVPGPSVMYDGYDRNFMDMDNLTSADGEVNGTYVVVTQPLPMELVITTEDIQLLREQLKQAESKTPQTPEDAKTPNDSEVIVSDKDEKIKWSFADGTIPEKFTSEAKIEIKSDKAVKVDFAYSGKLPEGTKVTVQLPKEGTAYKEGTILYFYYYNPKAKEYEYVSESITQNGAVTFVIEHCSEYLITSEKLVEVDIVEKEPDLHPIIVVGMVLFGAVGGAIGVAVNKKRKKISNEN